MDCITDDKTKSYIICRWESTIIKKYKKYLKKFESFLLRYFGSLQQGILKKDFLKFLNSSDYGNLNPKKQNYQIR